ncbi:GTP-binding protein [Saccharibacillus sp. CPCC 101409]|uniref:CobW family GTP-binding protein n=1 Tax=Saccharibacillus sp. CPCC 101409 TaxID=3058041 RepID=UPI0026727B9B|nr:GTP-binding protein [Saccharibacillus sp. CPCC 101409]MDO3410619.1 GTP-binding protein [Saccharibacillus sp. CPCC 101409]
MSSDVPVYLLSGFLGSGKTTLLQRLVAYWQEIGLRPGVIINELGEVNLDGLLVEAEVPLAELLGGCICCSVRDDLAGELAALVQRDRPDVVVIEATGAANPIDLLDAATETAMYAGIDLRGLITVADAAHLLEMHRSRGGKTYALMQDQLRCASAVILNKVDRVSEQEADELEAAIRGWNAYAPIVRSVRCETELEPLLGTAFAPEQAEAGKLTKTPAGFAMLGSGHEHVTSYTHRFRGPVDSRRFEALIAGLPREIYRAKGLLTFSDTASRFLFQYAFRELDFIKVTPQGDLRDMAVFIGEHFSASELRKRLEELETEPESAPEES